jgi:hypothetical protein
MSECDCDKFPSGPDGQGSAHYAKALPMFAGPTGGETAVAAAVLAQGRKHGAWLDRRGRLDDHAATFVEARSANDRSRLSRSAAQLFALASVPETDAEGMTVGGQVTKDGERQEGLIVSALGRDGKAVNCAKTDGRGIYRIVLTADEETLLQVTTAGGRKSLYLDDRPIRFETGGLAIRNIELADGGERPCPDGPDTSNRIVMPDVVGMAVDEAARELKANKIEVAGRRAVVRSGFEDRVVATEPEAGRLLDDPPKAVLIVGISGQKETDTKGKTGKPAKTRAAAAAEAAKPAEIADRRAAQSAKIKAAELLEDSNIKPAARRT